MTSFLHYAILILLLAAAVVSPSFAETIPSSGVILAKQDFEKGLQPWTSSTGTQLLNQDDNTFARMEVLADSVTTGLKTARLFSTPITLTGARSITVQFRYRSNVTDSVAHFGSWVYVFFSADGVTKLDPNKVIAVTAQSSSTWKVISQTITVPAGAVYAHLQPRLQDKIGQFDIDDIMVVDTESIPSNGIPQAAMLEKQNFWGGLGTWTSSVGTQILAEAGNNFGRMEITSTPQTTRFFSPPVALSGATEVAVQFRYRSNVTDSVAHFGSWVYVFFSADGVTNIDPNNVIAITAQSSANWQVRSQTIAVPAGAVYVHIQPRLQDKTGQFDIDDITVQSVAYHTRASFSLSKTTTNWVLAGNGPTLVNQNPSGAGEAPYSFTLPDEFCENKNLVYDVTATFTTTWSSPTVNPHGVFSLGVNIDGQEPNSLSIMLWNDQSLIVRMLPDTVAARAQTRNPITITQGEERTVRILAKADQITVWLDGVQIGQSTSPRAFMWPKGKAFYVGAEGQSLAPLDGVVTKFTLAVLEPKISAVFSGGRDFGYLVGSAPRTFDLSILPASGIPSIGMEATSEISIRDIDGSQIGPTLLPTGKTEVTHSYGLPTDLPAGWYSLIATVSHKANKVTVARPISILSTDVAREGVTPSIFGITEGYDLTPLRSDPQFFDDIFKRMSAMGIRWFRAWISWDYVEQTQGVYNWSGVDMMFAAAAKYGIEIYPCLHGGTKAFMIGAPPWPSNIIAPSFITPANLSLWKNYVAAFATRYKSMLRYYQVWNEADTRLYFYPFMPSAYISFLKDTGAVIKANDPGAKISLGGFAAAFDDPYFEKLTHADTDAAYGAKEFWSAGPQPYYDFFDYHFYSLDATAQSWDLKPGLIQGRIRPFLKDQGDGNKPLWNGETTFVATADTSLVGRQGGSWNVVYLSEKEQAMRLVQWYVQSKAVGIERNFWFTIRGEAGVINENFSPKLAYVAHANLVNLLRYKNYDPTSFVTTSNSSVRAYSFRSSTNNYVKVLWTVNGTQTLHVSSQSANVNVVSMAGRRKPLTGELALSEEPVYLESDGPFSLQE